MGLAGQRHSLTRRLALILPLVAAACGGDESGASTSVREQALAEVAGVLSIQDQVTLDRERTEIIERAIAECMTGKGFRYEPYLDAYFLNGAAHGLSTDLTSLDYAENHGFGIVDGAGAPPSVDIPADPNNEWLFSQPADLQVAWSTALDGPTADGSQTCREAGNEAFESEIGFDYDELGTIYEQVRSSPTVLAAQQAWSQCAAEAGFPAADRLALIELFDQRVSDLTGGAPFADGDPLADVDPTALAALRADEIAAAVATFPCSQEYDAAFAEALENYVA